MNSFLTRASAHASRLSSLLKRHPRATSLLALLPQLGGCGVIVSGPIRRSAAHVLSVAVGVASGAVLDLKDHAARILGA